MKAQRMLAVWFPDWPVRALENQGQPTAVIQNGEVLACCAEARKFGVVRGLRRREAQARCASLTVMERDEEAEARAFEPAVMILERLSPETEVLRPGLCMTATRGPSRYFGGDSALTQKIGGDLACGGLGEFRIGVAEGRFAAEIAARSGTLVPESETPSFLNPLPVEALRSPELTNLLKRLGVRTLGELGALPPEKVLDRFGARGRDARLLALGEELVVPPTRGNDIDFTLTRHFEDPVVSAENMGFIARGAAWDLLDAMAGHGLACRALAVEMHTVEGAVHRRVWHHEVAFDDSSIADRVRWQLDGWLTHGADTGPVESLILEPCGVVPANGRQFELWGGENDGDRRVARAVARVQSMLGFDSVLVPALVGGRHYEDRLQFIPWDERGKQPCEQDAPWPASMPLPAPSVIRRRPMPVSLLDGEDRPVMVGSRGSWSAEPKRIVLPQSRFRLIVQYSSPWLSDEKWWRADAKRRVSVQVLLDDGKAHLLVFEKATWWLLADYS